MRGTGKQYKTAPKFYRWLLKRAIKFPLIVVGIVIGFMFVSFFSYFSAGLGISFFPEIEPERFNLYSSGPIEKESGLRFQRLTYTATSLSSSDIVSVLPSAVPKHEEHQVRKRH